jgi:hypothetical protein
LTLASAGAFFLSRDASRAIERECLLDKHKPIPMLCRSQHPLAPRFGHRYPRAGKIKQRGKAMQLPPDDGYLAQRVLTIVNLGRRSCADQLTVGRLLSECQEHIQPGYWTLWLHHRLGIRPQTASRYVRAWRFSETAKGKQLVGFGAPYFTLSLLHTAEEQDIAAVLELAKSKGVAPHAGVVQTILARSRAISQADGQRHRGRRTNVPLDMPSREAILEVVNDTFKVDALKTIRRFIRDHRPKSNWNDIALEAIALLNAAIEPAISREVEGVVEQPMVAAE